MKDSVEDFLLKFNKAKCDGGKVERPTVRRVKSYPLYKLVAYSGKIIKLFQRATLKQFKKYFNINKTNRVVGWTPDYVGPTKSRYVKSDNIIVKVLHKIYPDIKDNVSKDFSIDLFRSLTTHRINYGAGYDTCHDHLKEYFKDNETEDTWTIDTILDILGKNNFGWFRSAAVSFNNVSELFVNVKINNDAYPGHYTSKFAGRTKGESDHSSRRVAARLWELMKYKPIKNNYLWTILGREKDIKVNYSEEVKEVGTRAVLTTENPATTLLMWFSQKIAYHLHFAKEKSITFDLIGELNGKKVRKIVDNEENYDWKLEADWSYFDSNIDTNFLIVAGLLITQGLPLDNLHENIAYYIIKSIVTKNVVLPPGIVVELNRAQPSGHPFGSLVNCYVNTIYWSLIGYQIYGDKYGENMKIEVYGDDTYAYFKDHPNLFKIDEYIEKCGLKSESLINNFRFIRAEVDQSEEIDFLKRRISLHGIKWNHKKMFDKLIYQSKNRSLTDQINLVRSYLETCPNDPDLKIMCDSFFRYVRNDEKIFNNIEDTELKSMLREERWISSRTIEASSSRSLYSYSTCDTLEMLKKYGGIYGWKVCRLRLKEDDLIDVVPSQFFKLDEVLLLLGFTLDEINQRDPDESLSLFNNKAPPSLSNKKFIDVIREYYQKVSSDTNNFINRRVNKLKLRLP